MKFFRGITDNRKPIVINPHSVVMIEPNGEFWVVTTTDGTKTVRFDGDLVAALEDCANDGTVLAVTETTTEPEPPVKKRGK